MVWYTVVCSMYGCSLLSTFPGRFYELAEWIAEQDNSAIFAAVTVENWIEREILGLFEEKGS